MHRRQACQTLHGAYCSVAVALLADTPGIDNPLSLPAMSGLTLFLLKALTERSTSVPEAIKKANDMTAMGIYATDGRMGRSATRCWIFLCLDTILSYQHHLIYFQDRPRARQELAFGGLLYIPHSPLSKSAAPPKTASAPTI